MSDPFTRNYFFIFRKTNRGAFEYLATHPGGERVFVPDQSKAWHFGTQRDAEYYLRRKEGELLMQITKLI